MSIQDSELHNKEVAAVGKLDRAIAKAKNDTGRDPRGGGFSFVANFEYIEQVKLDLPRDRIVVERLMIVGDGSGEPGIDDCDIAFWYQGIPIRLRENAAGGVHLMNDHRIPPSRRDERRGASAYRMALVRDGECSRPSVVSIDTGAKDSTTAGILDQNGRPVGVFTDVSLLTDAEAGRIVASGGGVKKEGTTEDKPLPPELEQFVQDLAKVQLPPVPVEVAIDAAIGAFCDACYAYDQDLSEEPCEEHQDG